MAVSPKAVVRELAQAVADLLTKQTFSENFFAGREWLAVNEIEDAERYLIQVIPDARIITRASRGKNQHDCTLNVTVQRRMTGESEGEIALVKLCDPVADFAQEIEDFVIDVDAASILTADWKATPLGAEVTMDMERLETMGIVAVNIAVVYRLWR